MKIQGKYKSKTGFFLRNIFFVLGVVSISSCSVYHIERAKHRDYKEWTAYQWQEEKRSKNHHHPWNLYSRKVGGSKIKEFKIIGKLPFRSEQVIQVFDKKTATYAEVMNKLQLYHSKSSWTFEPFDNQSCTATYTAQVDSSKRILNWMSYLRTKRALPKELENLRIMVEKYN
ncbi:MAG: hypothetical protein ABJN95_02645 [Maribacter sp.]|uniref:hypothetical protein n=1 Tax=Maribacter sp. TaxID=1897614 RepID=UPI0032968686